MKITKQVDSLYNWVDKHNAEIEKEIRHYTLLLFVARGKEVSEYALKLKELRNKLI
jgi:dsDNA-binding SOS-regulon protein